MVDVTFKIANGSFKKQPPSPDNRTFGAVAGAQNWARCVVKSHKTRVALSHFCPPSKGRCWKGFAPGRHLCKMGERPFHCEYGVWGEKGQPEAIPTCSGKATWGTEAKALTLQGEELWALRGETEGQAWGHPLGTSAHYSALNHHLFGDEELITADSIFKKSKV